MKRRGQNKNSLLQVIALSLFLILILVSTALLFKNLKSRENDLTGAVSAEGGNVTYINASKVDNSGFWQGYFGEITVDASASTPSATAKGGNVTELNLVLPCLGDEIYASPQNEIDFEDIAAGTEEAVDTFLNVSSSHLESGSSVFTTTRDFTISSTLITAVPTTFMKVSGSSDSPFALGVLNQSNVLVFVSNVSLNTIGFDGDTHDYQMMVPVNQSELTYYFFSDCKVVPPTPAPAAGGGGAVAGEAAGPFVGYCGDKICQLKETCTKCPADCGICPVNISEEAPRLPENVTAEEVEKKFYLIYVPYPLDKILNILEQQLFTLRGMAILLGVIITLLVIITWKVLKLRDRPPRLVFLKNR
ncbi:MAG: hypothetical protein Q8R47_02795 [Nanoarchaeota archaeon]|nr:hypothetical protein [Nanoarchaeota archaeon]